jgi:hypothetical protein
MDAKVTAGFWTDGKVEGLESPSEKLSLLWLMTARVNEAGWVPLVSIKRFEFETGAQWQDLQRACEALGEGIIIHAKGWWLRHFIRYQIGTGASLSKNLMARAVVKRFRDMPKEVVEACLLQYPELLELTKAFTSPSQVHGKDRRGEERRDQDRGAGERTDAPEGPIPWAEARLFQSIRDAYTVRKDSPQQVLDVIHSSVRRGADPQQMLEGTRECSKRFHELVPGGRHRYANSAKEFFSRELWNDPVSFSLKFEAPEGGDEKKGAAAVSPSNGKRHKHALDAEPEPGWRKVIDQIAGELELPLDVENVRWRDLTQDLRQRVVDRLAAVPQTTPLL